MKKITSSHYSEDFKLRVVQEVLQGKYSKEEARRIYGIRSNCAILYWIRQFSGQSNYRKGGISMVNLEEMKVKKENIDKDKKIKELEERLRRELLRADLWQKMVDVAEEDLKVDIRKKYGAK
jgi:transposase-like protein